MQTAMCIYIYNEWCMTRLKGSCGKCGCKFEIDNKKGGNAAIFQRNAQIIVSRIQKTTAIVGVFITPVLQSSFQLSMVMSNTDEHKIIYY